MSQNVTEKPMDAKRERAAVLVAEDDLSDEQIAESVGTTRRTLDRWKHTEPFMARVQEHRDAWRAAVMAEGIANRINRVNALNDRWRGMQQVIAERAADTSSGTYTTALTEDGKTERIIAPGWSTGLLVRTEKQIGAGDRAVHVIEFAVDTGLLREMRAHEEQAAKELGQWLDKHEHTGKDGAALFTITIDRRDDDSDDQ